MILNQAWKYVLKQVKGLSGHEEPQKPREIYSNDPRLDYVNNGISTSKYNVVTFLPLNLLEQFSKMANVYFLFIGLMQMVKSISITDGNPVILFPLLVVVFISMSKDVLEDKKRHDSDNKENNDLFSVLRDNTWIRCASEQIRVGEIVKVEKSERVPADILCIYSSGKQGECFIETKNLDGETNLKKKIAPKSTQKLGLIEVLQKDMIRFSYEPPNPYLYKFNGQVKTNTNEIIPVNDNNFILRGCSLQNTELIYGLVAYTGHETKIMLNSIKARAKKSQVEVQMNGFIALIFYLQMLFCFIAAMIAAVLSRETFNGLSYLSISKESTEWQFMPNFFVKWGTWILIFTNFVPISLLVTLEMVKYFQGKSISVDPMTQTIDLEDPSNNTTTTVLSSSLNEELGQVQYIFSDKTGTLTSNIMKYKCASINGVSYGDGGSEYDQRQDQGQCEQKVGQCEQKVGQTVHKAESSGEQGEQSQQSKQQQQQHLQSGNAPVPIPTVSSTFKRKSSSGLPKNPKEVSFAPQQITFIKKDVPLLKIDSSGNIINSNNNSSKTIHVNTFTSGSEHRSRAVSNQQLETQSPPKNLTAGQGNHFSQGIQLSPQNRTSTNTNSPIEHQKQQMERQQQQQPNIMNTVGAAGFAKAIQESNPSNNNHTEGLTMNKATSRYVDFDDSRLFEDISNKDSPNHQFVIDFLTMLAVCHTVVTEIDHKTKTIEYSASSPDELALLHFAKFVGMEFLGIDENDNILVKFQGITKKFHLLHVLEFNSTRKRMSVIVRDEDSNIQLFTKGADSVITKRMAKCDQQVLDQTWRNLSHYAQQGLRTLLCAKRIIPEEEYFKWNQLYSEASSALKDREEKMQEVQELIEVQLVMLGATAIDDKLQDQVGETISHLKQAGIKVWVLTGDKMETAVNIGYSCKLLQDDQEQILIDGETDEEVMISLVEAEGRIKEIKESEGEEGDDDAVILALILTGDSMIPCSKNPLLLQRVMEIADQCEVVLACRVSPKQKQEIVAMVKRSKPGATTLAIGDGANDVNMITEAHVGIGIRGKEGLQAARASDFAIGEFKILRNLLLYHGRECYRRNSALICYNFYKNMILVLPQLWYGISNGFSGASLYDPWIYQLYNMCYTSIPIFIFAIFDEEFQESELIRMPHEYAQGMKSLLFNQQQFLLWLLSGFWQAAVCCWVNYLGMETWQRYGRMVYFAATGNQSFGSSVIIGNLKVLIFSCTHTIMSLFFIFGSILFYLSNQAFASAYLPDSELYATFMIQMRSPFFWLSNLLIVGLIFPLELAFSYFKYSQKYQQRFFKIPRQAIGLSSNSGLIASKIHKTNGISGQIMNQSTKQTKIKDNNEQDHEKLPNYMLSVINLKSPNELVSQQKQVFLVNNNDTPVFNSPDSSYTLKASKKGTTDQRNEDIDQKINKIQRSRHFMSKTQCLDAPISMVNDISRSVHQGRSSYTGYAFSKEEKFTEFRKNNYLN